MNNKHLQSIIEGILFLYGEEGVSIVDLETVLENEKPSEIKNAIDALIAKYEKDESTAFSIQKFATNKYRLQTKPELHEYFAKLQVAETKSKLSTSTIEVLSIVAYKGPITKTSIDEIRGTDCSYQINKLREKRLIKSVGKDEENGKANLYVITDNFFKLFNISGGKEALPKIDEEEIKSEIENNIEKQDNFGKNIFGEDIFKEDETNE